MDSQFLPNASAGDTSLAVLLAARVRLLRTDPHRVLELPAPERPGRCSFSSRRDLPRSGPWSRGASREQAVG